MFVRYGSATPSAASAGIVISEFMAKNETGLMDETGKRRDWIELHNTTSGAVDLSGWSLSDDEHKWTFPPTSILPNDFVLVFASGKNRGDLPINHTNFKLAAAAGTLTLKSPFIENDGSTSMRTEHVVQYGPQLEDVSAGPVPPFTAGVVGSAQYFGLPTPGGPNVAPIAAANLQTPLSAPFVETDGGSQAGGFVQLGTKIYIFRTNTAPYHGDAETYYTTDGSEPSPFNPKSILANFPVGSKFELAIQQSLVFKCASYKTGSLPSDVVTRTYIIPATIESQTGLNGARPTSGIVRNPFTSNSLGEFIDFDMNFDVYSLSNTGSDLGLIAQLSKVPCVFLSSDDEDVFGESVGLYANASERGDYWERKYSFEWYVPQDGLSPSVYKQADVNARITGNTSRYVDVSPKHGFRVKFRSIYGTPKFVANIFQPLPSVAGIQDSVAGEFDQLELRNPTADTWVTPHWNTNSVSPRTKWASYVTDSWFSKAMHQLGHPSYHRRWVNLFINAKYWGAYEVIEHLDQNYAESYREKFGAELGDKFDVLGALSNGEGITVRSGNLSAWTSLREKASAVYNPQTAIQSGAAYAEVEDRADLDNLVDYMLLNFWGLNSDWPYHNYYMICPKSDDGEPRKFKFLSWDAEFCLSKVQSETVWRNFLSVTDGPGYLYRKLRYHSAFRTKIRDRLSTLCSGTGLLTPNSVSTSYAASVAEFQPFVKLESARWGDYVFGPSQPQHTKLDLDQKIQWLYSHFFTSRHTRLTEHVLADLTEVENEILTHQVIAATGTGYTPPASSTPAPVGSVAEGASMDSDRDGIPNAWETLHALNPNSPSDAYQDSDEDGVSNLREYLNGSDPWSHSTYTSGFQPIMEIYTPTIKNN
jgi:hypothetical protein